MSVKGIIRNPNGRPPASREKDMFALLDSVGIPLAIRHNIMILQGTHPSMKGMKDGLTKLKLQTDSSKILLSKAPDRVEGTGQNGEISIKFVNFKEHGEQEPIDVTLGKDPIQDVKEIGDTRVVLEPLTAPTENRGLPPDSSVTVKAPNGLQDASGAPKVG